MLPGDIVNSAAALRGMECLRDICVDWQRRCIRPFWPWATKGKNPCILLVAAQSSLLKRGDIAYDKPDKNIGW